MQELFYIVNVNNEDKWYRLHFLPTHHCLGGGENYEPLLKTVRRLIKKYKKVIRLGKAVEKICGPMSESTVRSYEKDYEEFSDCDFELDRVVKESFDEVKYSSPLMRSLKKSRKSKKSSLLSKVRKDKKGQVKEEEISKTDRGEIIIKRPRLLLRK